MERLTELKIGQILPIAVLNAWAEAGKNIYYVQWHSYTNVFKVEGDTKVSKLGSSGSSFYTEERGVDNRYNFNLVGFIEFYNKFYNLDNQPMKTTIEDWNNCVFYVNTPEQRNKIKELLLEIGFRSSASFKEVGYIRTNKNGTELSSGTTKNDWKGLLTNAREFEYERAIAALSSINPAEKTKWKKEDFYNTKIEFSTLSEADHFKEIIESVGLNWIKDVQNVRCIYFDSSGTGSYLSWTSKSKLEEYEKNSRILRYSDFIKPKQSINTNNTPLNTKTDGETIIIRRKTATVTDGQRPTGVAVSGRTSRTKVISGHLGYEAISSQR